MNLFSYFFLTTKSTIFMIYPELISTISTKNRWTGIFKLIDFLFLRLLIYCFGFILFRNRTFVFNHLYSFSTVLYIFTNWDMSFGTSWGKISFTKRARYRLIIKRSRVYVVFYYLDCCLVLFILGSKTYLDWCSVFLVVIFNKN